LIWNGCPSTEGKERTLNKVNQSMREAVQMAFEHAGGVEYLVRLAQRNTETFVPLLIKTMLWESNAPRGNGLHIQFDLT
jgi:hypothetical protein